MSTLPTITLTNVDGTSVIYQPPVKEPAPPSTGADDTASLQAALTAAVDPTSRFGSCVLLQPRDYIITRTLSLTNVIGMIIAGQGGRTRLIWAGPADQPMFELPNWRGGHLRDFRVQSSSKTPLAEGVRLRNSSLTAIAPGRNRFTRIVMEGTDGGLGCGYRLAQLAGDSNNNQDFNQWDQCETDNYSGCFLSIEHSMALCSSVHDSQALSNRHGKCAVAGSPDGTAGAVSNIFWRRGFAGGHTKADFYWDGAPRSSSIDEFDGENSARFLLTNGPSGAAMGCTVRASRWASDGMADDGEFIQYLYSGLSIEDSYDLGGDYSKAMAIRLDSFLGAPQFLMRSVRIVAKSLSFPTKQPIKVACSVQSGDSQWAAA